MPPARLIFTVRRAFDGDDGTRKSKALRITLPQSPKWEQARAAQVLDFIRERHDALGLASPSTLHLRTTRGPIGNHEPLRVHVAAGDEVDILDGEAPPTRRSNVWLWGLGHTLHRVPSLAGADVRSIALGNSHAVVLTGAGLVLTWGGNDFGQLGDGTERARRAPALVGALACQQLKIVCAGPNMTAAVSTEGELYTWGQYQPSNRPTRFVDSWCNGFGATPCGTRVLQVACGTTHMGVVVLAAADGPAAAESAAEEGAHEVYLWGYNEHAQCGLGGVRELFGLQKPTHALQLPAELGPPVALACGAAHSLVLTRSGALVGCGSNEHGQLGLPTRTTRVAPTRVLWGDESVAVAEVRAAGHASLVRMRDGRALLLGQLEGGGSSLPGGSLPPQGPEGGGGGGEAGGGGGGAAAADAADDGDGVPQLSSPLLATRVPVGDEVRAMALSAAHVLLLDGGGAHGAPPPAARAPMTGFGYNRYAQASATPLPAAPAFLTPDAAARIGHDHFGWEHVLAISCGGGQSAVLSAERHSLAELCEGVLLRCLGLDSCATLLDAAVRTHSALLARECVAFIERVGRGCVLGASVPADADLAHADARLVRLMAEARALFSGAASATGSQ